MNIYVIIAIIILIITSLILIFVINYTKLKKYKEKMDNAENIIEDCLQKKLDLIIKINGEIKQVTGEKDYLKEYVSINNLIISNVEKDLKLDEANNLIQNIKLDYKDLNNDKSFKKNIVNLREINEKLVAAKNIFNSNAMKSNQFIKNFPTNIIAKLSKISMRSFYNNKSDELDNF